MTCQCTEKNKTVQCIFIFAKITLKGMYTAAEKVITFQIRGKECCKNERRLELIKYDHTSHSKKDSSWPFKAINCTGTKNLKEKQHTQPRQKTNTKYFS